MDKDIHLRSRPLFGEKGLDALKKAHVIVFGLGGVGGHAVEALARSGVGTITVVDPECYEWSNLNRQLFATINTVGIKKADVAASRIGEIAPDCEVHSFPIFYTKETEPEGLFEGVDYILDAIDSVPSKLDLIDRANEMNIPIISSMGTGNKLDPCGFCVSDIHKTSVCPLAKKIRLACKKKGIRKLKVVYSKEEPKTKGLENENQSYTPASTSFVPGVAGMILASEIIKDITKICLS
jgi:tRNA A37 threonylcarbamoyladenosine dehydratase